MFLDFLVVRIRTPLPMFLSKLFLACYMLCGYDYRYDLIHLLDLEAVQAALPDILSEIPLF